MEFARRPESSEGVETPPELRQPRPTVEEGFAGYSYTEDTTKPAPTDTSALQHEVSSLVRSGDMPDEPSAEVTESGAEGFYLPDTKFEGLPVLPRAEDLDPAMIKDHIARLIERHAAATPDRRPGALMDIASALSELGLATHDDTKAAAAFIESQELYLTAAARFGPDSINQLRAERAAAFAPVWPLRRDRAGRAEIAQVAYGALAQSLLRVQPLLENRQDLPRSEMGHTRTLGGLLAEDSVAALRAREGQPTYLSSAREGYGGQLGERRQASDFHQFGRRSADKVRVEVKLTDISRGSRPYDPKNVVVVSYLNDVCKPMMERYYPRHSRPPVFDLAMKLSRLLAQEGSGVGVIGQADQRMLDYGSSLVKQKIDNWRQQRAQEGNRGAQG